MSSLKDNEADLEPKYKPKASSGDVPWQEGLDPKAQTGTLKGLCDLFKSDTKMSNSIILQ